MTTTVEPSFGEMADELLAWVRHEAALAEFAEPFMAGIPVNAPGMWDAHTKMKRRLIVFAATHKLIVGIKPFEAELRVRLDLAKSIENIRS